MRVITSSKEEILPFTELILSQLTEMMLIISKNPSNPKFTHFLFESVSALVK